MKNLLKLSVLCLVILLGFTSNIDAQEVNGGDRTVLPFLKKGYRPSIGIAPVVGIQITQDVDEMDFVYGVEFSLQCPLYQCKKNHIRQQFSIVQTKRDNFTSLAFELAPHYKLPLGTTGEIGVGPHVGYNLLKYTILDTDFKANAFEYGLGGSLNFAFGQFYIGADARYVWTSEVEYDINKVTIKAGTVNNFRALAKIGYRF